MSLVFGGSAFAGGAQPSKPENQTARIHGVCQRAFNLFFKLTDRSGDALRTAAVGDDLIRYRRMNRWSNVKLGPVEEFSRFIKGLRNADQSFGDPGKITALFEVRYPLIWGSLGFGNFVRKRPFAPRLRPLYPGVTWGTASMEIDTRLFPNEINGLKVDWFSPLDPLGLKLSQAESYSSFIHALSQRRVPLIPLGRLTKQSQREVPSTIEELKAIFNQGIGPRVKEEEPRIWQTYFLESLLGWHLQPQEWINVWVGYAALIMEMKKSLQGNPLVSAQVMDFIYVSEAHLTGIILDSLFSMQWAVATKQQFSDFREEVVIQHGGQLRFIRQQTERFNNFIQEADLSLRDSGLFVEYRAKVERMGYPLFSSLSEAELRQLWEDGKLAFDQRTSLINEAADGSNILQFPNGRTEK